MVCILFLALCGQAFAETTAEHREKRPELFDDETGYRIGRQRGPTPNDIPGPARIASPEETRRLLESGALALDVYGAQVSRFDELDGTWLVSEQRLSLPGAVWLPEVGRGVLTEEMEAYLAGELSRGTSGDTSVPVVVFCVADCWMSWNAAQRIAAMGYENVHWFRLGTDGWIEIGGVLEPVDPVPVPVD